jgi:hypothetical protein
MLPRLTPRLLWFGRGDHAFAMPGKHDAVSLWVDLSDCEAFRTFDPSQEQVYQREWENVYDFPSSTPQGE